ncbi:unnamed protein product, partial [Cercopithifilaria johnstoni]
LMASSLWSSWTLPMASWTFPSSFTSFTSWRSSFTGPPWRMEMGLKHIVKSRPYC